MDPTRAARKLLIKRLRQIFVDLFNLKASDVCDQGKFGAKECKIKNTKKGREWF